MDTRATSKVENLETDIIVIGGGGCGLAAAAAAEKGWKHIIKLASKFLRRPENCPDTF